ncbi:MAG: oligosaccharide flippase family protein, partial [Rikenellaceae bacterium]
MTNSLKQQATSSVLWSAIERFSVQGAQYIISIIIARLLIPSDYGLIAMLSIFIAISQTFIDGGFANALIQKKERTEVDYSTVFYFNIAI